MNWAALSGDRAALLVAAGVIAALVAFVGIPARTAARLARLIRREQGRSTLHQGSGVRAKAPAWLGRLGARLATGLGARRAAERRNAAIREALEVLAAELRAGRSTAEALASAAEVDPSLERAAVAGREGGDVGAEFGLSDVRVLRRLATAWSVGQLTGAALSELIERIVASLRDDEALAREVAAALAGPRATGRLLAALPLLGLAMGTGVGADPVGFLLGNGYGRICFLAGMALAVTGLWWVEALARRAERVG